MGTDKYILSLGYAGTVGIFFYLAFSFGCTSGTADDKLQQKISNLLLCGEALPEVIVSFCFPSPC